MDFLSKDEKILEKEFLDQGYIIREAANKDALKKIQKFAIDMLSRKGGDSLDNTHKSISINELNDFRLDVIKEINAQPWLREAYYHIAKPYLDIMGKNIVHAGGMGNGQAAKICNNMILGISMIAVSESFAMAEKLGLSAQNLFDITSSSSSQCWAMTSYLPVPGPVPASPANNDYQPGFTGAMMAKDMKLARDAAISSGQKTELADSALQMYERFLAEGGSSQDFSAIYKMIHNSN